MPAKAKLTPAMRKKIDDLVKAHLEGQGFWSDFKDGFMSVMRPVGDVLGLIPHPAAQIGSKVIGVADKLGGRGLYDYDNDNDDDYSVVGDGGSYGLYIKKNRKRHQKKGGQMDQLDRPLGSGLKKRKVGRPKREGKKSRKFDANSKTARRAKIVREVMHKYGLSLPSASAYVKKHNIPY
jgi:hypothetical protein